MGSNPTSDMVVFCSYAQILQLLSVNHSHLLRLHCQILPITTDISPFFSSVQSLSRVRLCDSVDCSTPGSPVHHQLPKLAQTMSIESVMPSNHLVLCRPLLLLPSVTLLRPVLFRCLSSHHAYLPSLLSFLFFLFQ